MQDEQFEILAFLASHEPFRELDGPTLQRLAESVDVRYFKGGSPIVEFGQDAQFWHIVRSGVVEVFRRDGTLYNRVTEGAYFGEFGLLHRKRVRFPARAAEDTLLYLVPEPVFTELFETHELFADKVEIEDRTRLRQAVLRQQTDSGLLSADVQSLLQGEAVTIPESATAREAAQRMTEHDVSSLLVVRPDPDTGRPVLAGIVTDRDIRSRLVAGCLDMDTPVVRIATQDVIAIDHNRLVFEAMMLMLRHNVHHLPVLAKREPVGVLAMSDIVRLESQSSLFVVAGINRAASVEELAVLAREARASFVKMVEGDLSSRIVGSTLSAIGRAFKQRLLELAEQRFGPPPVPYCFLALGSMARQEQLVVTDQDNALILDNSYDEAVHDAYFEQLARFVCDGLAQCGYAYCTGGVMASNRQWRQPLRVWEARFREWIENPTPESLLHSNIFFDIDGVAGRTEWADSLRAMVARHARAHPRFLASMARNALLRTPPLGFFKDFVLEVDGRHSAAINLKRRGTAPLSDLIRVHALGIGSEALNSFDRLDEVVEAGALPPGRGPALHDALEFISMVRIRNQARDLKGGREPDNSIEPDQLSEFERKSLRDAFTILSHAQDYLKFRFQSARGPERPR